MALFDVGMQAFGIIVTNGVNEVLNVRLQAIRTIDSDNFLCLFIIDLVTPLTDSNRAFVSVKRGTKTRAIGTIAIATQAFPDNLLLAFELK